MIVKSIFFVIVAFEFNSFTNVSTVIIELLVGIISEIVTFELLLVVFVICKLCPTLKLLKSVELFDTDISLLVLLKDILPKTPVTDCVSLIKILFSIMLV